MPASMIGSTNCGRYMLYLKLFGGFSLVDSRDQPIIIESAKPRALLTYLALNSGRRHNRSQLASLLWGEQSESRARHSLTQALSSLSHTLQDKCSGLQRYRNQVCLEDDCIDVDANRLLHIGDDASPLELLEAVRLFEPDPLEEFSFGEPGYDEWVLTKQQYFREKGLRAGLNFLSIDETLRSSESSIEVARKLLRIDPFFEPAHRALIQLHIANNDRVAAQRQADVCTAVLKDDLGVEPMPETYRAISQIRMSSESLTRQDTARERGISLRETPSIVILALQNLTEDSSLNHICQGLADDITTELARFRTLFVISRESAFQLSTESTDIAQLCRRLGVRHALCGSLRPHRNKFRINLRLVEGSSEQSVWTEKYDLAISEILDISDDVTGNLVSRLSITLEDDALSRSRQKPSADWSAYDHLLQGLVYHHRGWYGTGMLFGAIKHFKKAVELYPELARAHAYLACAISSPWYKDRETGSLDRCIYHARRAVEIDPFEAEAQRLLGGVYLVRGEHELANHHFDTALQVHPGNAHVLAHAAKYQAFVGEDQSAISLLNKARQLNPLHPDWYWQHMGVARFGQEEYEEAIRMFGRLPFLVFFDRIYLAAAHAHLGNIKSARHHLAQAISDKPSLSRCSAARYLPYSTPDSLANAIEGLTIAGLT